MPRQLPLELVLDVLSTAVEVSLSDGRRNVALELARAGSLAYTAVTPILYRTLTVDEHNYEMVLRIFQDRSPVVIGVLSQPPLQRLCVHVRRVFLEGEWHLDPKHLCQFRNLSAIYCASFGHGLFQSDGYQQLARTVKQVYALTTDYPTDLPRSVTHVSLYMRVSSTFEVTEFETLVKSLPPSVTHIALEINTTFELTDGVANEGVANKMLELLKDLLARNTTAPVVLRLYSHAAEDGSMKIVLDTISRLESSEARMRVHLWHDERSINAAQDIPTSKLDAIVGRTPWSEASVKLGNMMLQGPRTLFGQPLGGANL